MILYVNKRAYEKGNVAISELSSSIRRRQDEAFASDSGIYTYIVRAYKCTSKNVYNVHTYIRTYILTTYVHTYTHTYIHTYVHTYMRVYSYIGTYVRTYILHTYVPTVHMYVRTYVHTSPHTVAVGVTHQKARRLLEASQYYDRALKTCPNHVDALVARGSLYTTK